MSYYLAKRYNRRYSRASSCKPLRLATNRFSFKIGTCGTIESACRVLTGRGVGNRMKKVPPGEAAHFFSARA